MILSVYGTRKRGNTKTPSKQARAVSLASRSVPMDALSLLGVGTIPGIFGNRQRIRGHSFSLSIRILSIAYRLVPMDAPLQVGVGLSVYGMR